MGAPLTREGIEEALRARGLRLTEDALVGVADAVLQPEHDEDDRQNALAWLLYKIGRCAADADGAVDAGVVDAVLGERGEERELCILHFNDVYNVEEGVSEPCGGLARFGTVLRGFYGAGVGWGAPLLFFSGDAFSPSVVSNVTKGEHMARALSLLGVSASVVGNHDLDYGLSQFARCVRGTGHPWLSSNLLDRETGLPLAPCVRKLVLESASGVRVGVFGVVERGWVDTLGSVDAEVLSFLDPVSVATALARELREEDGVDVVVALTHSRQPEDLRLAELVPEVDLILGGHDHHLELRRAGRRGTPVCKSGTDFQNLTEVRLRVRRGRGRPQVLATLPHRVDRSVPEDAGLRDFVAQVQGGLGSRLRRVIARLAHGMDGRFTEVRARETALGNFFCDIVRERTGADVALVQGGTFRSDRPFPAGAFTLGDLVMTLPFQTPMVVLAVRGDNLLRALENGVSAAPAFEGRFPQLSGARILYDSTRPPGSRILFASITSEHQSSSEHHSSSEPHHSSDLLVRPEAVYRVACPFYLAQGRDGYGALRPDAPGNGVVVGIEEAQTLVTLVRTHLRLVAAANGFVHIADKGLQRALQRVKQARVDAADALSSKFGRAASQSVAVTALHHYEHVERQRHAHAHALSRDDARGPRDHELWDERDEGEEDDDAGDDCEDDGGDEDDGGVGGGRGDGAGDATGDVARLISAVSMTRLVDYTELTDEHLSHASQVSHSHSDEDGDVGLVLDSTAVSHADESQTSNSASVVASTDTAPPTPSPGSSSARAPPAASVVPLVRTASLPVDVPLLARTPSGAIHPKFVRGHADGAPPTSAHPPPRRPARHVRVPRRAEEKVKLAPDVEGRILDCSGRISGAPSVVEHASPLLALRLRQAHDLLKHHT